jgi:hypothetical protein
LSPEGLKIFLEEKSVPIVLELNKDPSNHAYLVKIFNGVGPKVSWIKKIILSLWLFFSHP